MGMPGSKTALEELMCRVLGDLLQEGCVSKIANDLFCIDNSPEELLFYWKKVLVALDKCDFLRFNHYPWLDLVLGFSPGLTASHSNSFHLLAPKNHPLSSCIYWLIQNAEPGHQRFS